jgi:hypothetical protein
MYLAARPPVNVSEYRGDGTIIPLPNPINPGFKIDFPPFLLTAPRSATFRLEGLPRPRGHSPYELGLAVDLTSDEASHWPTVPSWLKAGKMGSIRFRVATASGPVILNFEADLAGQYWSRRTDDPQVFAVLRTGSPPSDVTSRFASDIEPEMIPTTLAVEYTPGSDSQARQARVRLVAGGED